MPRLLTITSFTSRRVLEGKDPLPSPACMNHGWGRISFYRASSYSMFKNCLLLWLVNDTLLCFTFLVHLPSSTFYFSLIALMKNIKHLMGSTWERKLEFHVNKLRFIIKPSLSWFNLIIALLAAILWRLVGTNLKMKFFLWTFYLFEMFLGFVVSIKCSDTLPLPFFRGWAWTAAFWLWLWDRRGILPRMRSSRASKILNFKPT